MTSADQKEKGVEEENNERMSSMHLNIQGLVIGKINDLKLILEEYNSTCFVPQNID